jgi:hypothetical protein
VKPGSRPVVVPDLVPVTAGTNKRLLGKFLGQVTVTDEEAEQANEAVVFLFTEGDKVGWCWHAESSPCSTLNPGRWDFGSLNRGRRIHDETPGYGDPVPRTDDDVGTRIEQAGGSLVAYPGRGLVAGSLNTGSPFLVYFMTGRSSASLDRQSRTHHNGAVSIEPTSRTAADDLRHYMAITPGVDCWYVGNGTHVEALAGYAIHQLPAQFRSWGHEPDPPIWTPRIIAGMTSNHEPRLMVAAVRRTVGGGTEHLTLDVATTPKGYGLRIATYDGSIDHPRPHAQPQWVRTSDSIADLATEMWKALPTERRVLVIARDLGTNQTIYIHRDDPPS